MLGIFYGRNESAVRVPSVSFQPPVYRLSPDLSNVVGGGTWMFAMGSTATSGANHEVVTEPLMTETPARRVQRPTGKRAIKDWLGCVTRMLRT